MKFLRRIDVLLNEETGERFDRDDIVKITTIGTFSREIIGRIEWIETLELTLDKSEQYKNRTEKIKYEDITKIEKFA
jgi:hypothetical protein